MQKTFDRTAEDLGNSVILEHVNVKAPDQRLSTLFYIAGLGLTRDPFLVTSVTNMWVNCGRNQFHMPTGEAQVMRGRTGLVIEGRDALLQRLEAVAKPLEGTKFAFEAHNDHVDATCPWGNRVRVHEPDRERFGPIRLGMPYIEFAVPMGTADGIARFYSEILEVPATAGEEAGAMVARAHVGHFQHLVYRETDAELPEYDGHHIAIYLVNFSRPHARLAERGLVSEESNQHQYRFLDLVDPKDNRPLFRIEHEVRCMTHPLFGRQHPNRNPVQTNTAYAMGYDEAPWVLPYRA